MRTLIAVGLLTLAGCSGREGKEGATGSTVTTGSASAGGPRPAVSTGSPSAPGTTRHAYPEVHTGQLFDAYEANVVAADQRFRDRPLKVRGTVQRIERDGLGLNVVADDYDKYLPNIQCRFHPTTQHELARVKKGQPVTVLGTVTGSRKDASAWHELVVTLDGCRLLD
jgi:hypothetical protein